MTMLRYSGGSRTSGYVTITDPDAPHGMVQEGETVSCVHCRFFWIVEQGSGRERGWCNRCNGLVCGKKKCMTRCDPWEKQIEAMERIGRRLEAVTREMEMENQDARSRALVEAIERGALVRMNMERLR